jgi:hypothetical protein
MSKKTETSNPQTPQYLTHAAFLAALGAVARLEPVQLKRLEEEQIHPETVHELNRQGHLEWLHRTGEWRTTASGRELLSPTPQTPSGEEIEAAVKAAAKAAGALDVEVVTWVIGAKGVTARPGDDVEQLAADAVATLKEDKPTLFKGAKAIEKENSKIAELEKANEELLQQVQTLATEKAELEEKLTNPEAANGGSDQGGDSKGRGGSAKSKQ